MINALITIALLLYISHHAGEIFQAFGSGAKSIAKMLMWLLLGPLFLLGMLFLIGGAPIKSGRFNPVVKWSDPWVSAVGAFAAAFGFIFAVTSIFR